MHELTKHLLIIVAVATAVFFTNLGQAKLWDRDEPRNAGCAKEMLQKGDWVVPVFNDELRAQKPVLLYWLMMSAYSIFGVNEFAARFWSAILAVGTVVGTYMIARRLFDSQTALLGSVVLATTVMFGVAGRAATPDSVLIFCGTMALMVYTLSAFRKAPENSLPKTASWFPDRLGPTIAMYSFLGLGTLAKGPIGFLLPMAIIGMFMLIMRSSVSTSPSRNGWIRGCQTLWQVLNPIHFAKTVWAMKPLIAMAVVLAIATPWYVLVGHQTEGDFLNRFFLTENLARATTAMENHSGGLWYYPATLLFGFFPWSVFALPVGLFVWRKLKRTNDADRFAAVCFLCCWTGVQVGLFSLASTKLPSYVTPCYPALAILVANALVSYTRNYEIVSQSWYRFASIVLALNGVAAVAGMIFVAQRYLDGDVWIGLIGLAPLLGGSAAYWLMRKDAKPQAVAAIALSAALFSVGVFGFGTVAIDRHRDMASVLEPMQASTSEVATFGVLESSWVFYSDRRLFELAPDTHPKLPKSLKRKKHWKPKPWVSPETFAANEGGLILTTDEKVETLLRRLPDYEIIERSPYFLQDQDLVLVGPAIKRESRQAARQPRPSSTASR